jgi:hypothetical protein
MQLRCLMSANSSSMAFDLRCHVREQLIKFLQDNYPQSLPTRRDAVTLHQADCELLNLRTADSFGTPPTHGP